MVETEPWVDDWPTAAPPCARLCAEAAHSLALVRSPLQHGGHLQQGAVVPKLGQHLKQQHNGAVHVPGEAAWSVNLIHRDPPDALYDSRYRL